MPGAEQNAGRPRQFGRPVFKPYGETSGSGQQGSAIDLVRGLTQRQRRLNLPDVNEYLMKWSDMKLETSGGRVPEATHQMILHISRGLDFLLFDKVNLTQRGSILREIQQKRRLDGIEQVELTHEEGLILKEAAAAVNVAYDPGTPEEVEKRTFKFADLEQKAQQQGVELPYWYRLLNGD